jgi:hypothetical protein
MSIGTMKDLKLKMRDEESVYERKFVYYERPVHLFIMNQQIEI